MFLALAFVTLPFVVRTVQPVLEQLDADVEEAAASLGATRLTTFRRIILPSLVPAIAAGAALSFARGISEYGSLVLLSGNLPNRTEVASVRVLAYIENGDTTSAAAVATLMLLVALGVIVALDLLQRRVARRGLRPRSAGAPPGALGPAAARGRLRPVPRVAGRSLVVKYTFADGMATLTTTLSDPEVTHALRLTFVVALLAVLVNLIFGVGISILLVRYEFPGKRVLSALIDVPLSVSPVVVGLALVLVYNGRNGWFGPGLSRPASRSSSPRPA